MRGKAQTDRGRTDDTPDTPISDQELEAAHVELRTRVTRDVAALLKAKRLLVPADELDEAVQYAFRDPPSRPSETSRVAANRCVPLRGQLAAQAAPRDRGRDGARTARRRSDPPRAPRRRAAIRRGRRGAAGDRQATRSTAGNDTLTAAGYSRQEISARLGIAPGSVKHYAWLARRNLCCQFRP
jgi:hypothetical protein